MNIFSSFCAFCEINNFIHLAFEMKMNKIGGYPYLLAWGGGYITILVGGYEV